MAGLVSVNLAESTAPPISMPCVAVVAPAHIRHPGFYCLDRDHISTERTGAAITVVSQDVTLDLGRHALRGPSDPAGTSSAIHAIGAHGLTVRGGVVTGFAFGIRVDATARSTVRNLTAIANHFRGIRITGDSAVVTGNVILETGGSTAFPDAFSMGIEVHGNACQIDFNAILETYPTAGGSGEGVGIENEHGQGCRISSNTIINSRLPLTGRTFAVWSAGEGQISGNLARSFTYGFEGSGAADNIAVDMPCRSYQGFPLRDSVSFTRPPPSCPDDLTAALAAVDSSERNSLFRVARIYQHAEDWVLSLAYYQLAARAGSGEAKRLVTKITQLVSPEDADRAARMVEAIRRRHKDRVGKEKSPKVAE